MKTIFDMELIKRIWENPLETIGQRDYRLFESYCLPFLDYQKIENDDIINKHLEKYPSIHEAIEEDYKINLGTAHWTRPLEYISEDNRELYDRSFKYIFAYEEKYPTPAGLNITYMVDEDRINYNFRTLLGTIGYRPAMFFGVADFGCLRAYIDGYFAFKGQYQLAYSDFEKQVQAFIQQYKKEKLEYHQTWDRNYRWKWAFNVFGGFDSGAISRFLEDLEKFAGEKINPIINDKEVNIDWHEYRQSYPRIEIE